MIALTIWILILNSFVILLALVFLALIGKNGRIKQLEDDVHALANELNRRTDRKLPGDKK